MFIGTHKISETVNVLDSDGSSFSEISDSDMCMVEYILITINKKFHFDNHIHERVTQVISRGLLKFLCGIIHTTHAVSVRRCLVRFLALLKML
jgi:hypothetical protein